MAKHRLTSRMIAWIDRRTGLHSLLHKALDEPIPGGAKLAYIFGSGLLIIFILQIITGIFLALYYVPAADHAYSSVAYVTKAVTSGSLLRGLHSYGASAMIIVLVLHFSQTFIYGSFKGPRELLWLSGCVLFVLVLGMGFTGYLLPWDQKAYFATTVGTNIAAEVPLIGEWIKRMLRGGTDMGTLTISRFFAAHVFFIPGCIFAFISLHVFLFRKAGAAGPISEDPVTPRLPTEPFYPRQLFLDLGLALLLIAALWIVSHYHHVELGPVANPADTQYVARPEWYYRSFFEWLKYWEGSRAIWGILVIPLIVALLFAGTPFLDRGHNRKPRHRPLAMLLYMFIMGGLVFLGWKSYRDDRNNPAIAAQLLKQDQETAQLMTAAFEPELSGAGSMPSQAASGAVVPPTAAKGKTIFSRRSCDACHGDAGEGTSSGPKLTDLKQHFPAEKLGQLVRHPTDKMIQGGMVPLQISDNDLAALVEYLRTLR